MMRVVPGNSIGFLNCPHCGKESEFLIGYNEAHVICSDHNCLSKMSVHWGTSDEPYRFINKMKSNWNKRTPDGNALIQAKDYIEKYRSEIYDKSQEEYSDYCRYCVEVIDVIIDKLLIFTP